MELIMPLSPVRSEADSRVNLRVEVKTVLYLRPGAHVPFRRPDEPDVLIQPHSRGVSGVHPEHELRDMQVVPVLRRQEVFDQPFAEPFPAQARSDPYRLDVPGRGRIFPVHAGIRELASRYAEDLSPALRHRPFRRPYLVYPVIWRLCVDVLNRLEKGTGGSADSLTHGVIQGLSIP